MLGAALAIHPAAYFFGSLLARFLMKWCDPDTLVPLGLALLISGASGLVSLNFIDSPSLLYVGSAISLVGLGLAQISPPLVTAIMSNQAKNAGLASSLLGFSQMMTGVLIGAVASMISDPTLAYAAVVPGAILLASCFGIYWYLSRNILTITSSPQTLS
ncbi:hypothetical protein A9Q96_13850 [Rhodobacterales bacterium 52_120_T64]|nr:hypothetical protein A9Q96_13850 [Rhodobacterales bacterium 52_120_T64]